MKRYKKTSPRPKDGKRALLSAGLVLLAAALLFVGNRMAMRNVALFSGNETVPYYIARVDLVVSVDVTTQDYGGAVAENTRTTFYATVLAGSLKGTVLTVTQDVETSSYGERTLAKAGDKVIVRPQGGGYVMTQPFRTDVVLIFAALFAALLIVFGGARGVTALLSLVISLASVFLFLVPALLSGFNVYVCALLVCAFNILVSPLLVAGFNKKALASILGCCGGVAVAAGFTLALDRLLRLTGVTNDEMMYISHLNIGAKLDLNALIFATVLIGALGALIDVSISIASPTMELHEQKPMSFRELLKSAFNIGRDIMGAQTSTLVLAYVGCSLPMALVLAVYQNSLTEMLNFEAIAADMMEALVGAFAILFTIPATALTTSLLCTRRIVPAEPRE